MNNSISPINFKGSWQCLQKCEWVEGDIRYVFHQVYYHPKIGESTRQIKKAMNELRDGSGWSYSVWRKHPNGGKRNGGGIYEIYVPQWGLTGNKPKDVGCTDAFISHESMLEVANVNTTPETFKLNHSADNQCIFDVIKLKPERIKEIIDKYFKKAANVNYLEYLKTKK